MSFLSLSIARSVTPLEIDTASFLYRPKLVEENLLLSKFRITQVRVRARAGVFACICLPPLLDSVRLFISL